MRSLDQHKCVPSQLLKALYKIEYWLFIACTSDAALGKTITVDFTQGASSEFSLESGTEITYGDDGAEFIITSAGLARTIISNKYIFFGKVEVFLKAAAGTGIVSSFVMESDDLDEIDLVGPVALTPSPNT